MTQLKVVCRGKSRQSLADVLSRQIAAVVREGDAAVARALNGTATEADRRSIERAEAASRFLAENSR